MFTDGYIFYLICKYLKHVIISGVARNFERGFPNDRAGGVGAQPPRKNGGLGGHSPLENF